MTPRKPKRTRLYRRPQDERVERRRATRIAHDRGGVKHDRAAGPLDPVDIPSEARMLRNLERAWDDAEPGEDGLAADRPLRHPTL